MSGAYSRDSYADPDSFVLQVGMILAQHAENVIVSVTDPLNPHSIQRRHPRFPPNVGEFAEACEAEAVRLFKIAEAAHQPKMSLNREYVSPPNFPGSRANVFVHAGALQYEALVAWSKTENADARDWRDEKGRAGIHVSLSVLQTFHRNAPKSLKAPTVAEMAENLMRTAGRKPAGEIFPEGS